MALIVEYRLFKENLQGYCGVSFNDFRNRLMPLKKKQAWSPDEYKYVEQLANEGAQFAIQELVGLTHPALVAMDWKESAREMFAADELKNNLDGLIKNCQKARWTKDIYLGYIYYLSSGVDLKPDGLSANKAAATPPERDHFAEMYRSAGPQVKNLVIKSLTDAATNTSLQAPSQASSQASPQTNTQAPLQASKKKKKKPAKKPTKQSSIAAAEPAVEPAAEPATEPAAEPTAEPTAEPAAEPAAEPTVKPAWASKLRTMILT